VENLRHAARAFHGVEIPAGRVFSFWRQLGRTTKGKGFTEGRELREGCLVPAVGGGLCQLSGLLYQAALEAGLEIVERHGHSRVIAGSAAEKNLDATVFWNYVDLRFRSDVAWRVEVELSASDLVVRIRSSREG
jgi:vancomycin resistance protein YoaR